MSEVKTKTTFPYADADLECIRRDSAAQHDREPCAEAARFDGATGLLHLQLRGGTLLSFPARRLPGLSDVPDEALAGVRVVDGRALFWDSLDVQMSLLAILGTVLGVLTASESARRAGSATTPAKAQAARVNGQKGGRPRRESLESSL